MYKMSKDIIEQEFRALESIVASESIPLNEKFEAMKKYETFMSKQTGITLRALKEVGHIIHFKGLSEKQVLNELRAVENVFVKGALNTAKKMNKPLSRNDARKIFSNYVNQHFKIKIGRQLRTQRLLRKKTNKRPGRKIRKPRPK